MTQLTRYKHVVFFFVAGVAALLILPVTAQCQADTVDAQALTILDRATSFLASQQQFSAKAEIWEDFAVSANTHVQFAETVNILLRRPDRFKLQVTTTAPKKTFFYNGKEITLLDQGEGFYGTTAAPDTIDKTVAQMNTVYGLTFPLDDMLLSAPFGDAVQKANAGQYWGVELISEIPCHHLAFQGDRINWQVWIEDGVLPLVRKIVITDKTEEGEPQFIAHFTSWGFSTELPDYLFTFEPSSQYLAIDIMKTKQDNN